MLRPVRGTTGIPQKPSPVRQNEDYPKVSTYPGESTRLAVVSDAFFACSLPWAIWPWGLTLAHSDNDTVPDCSVEFGVQVVRPSPPYEQLWVRVEFELAAFASAKPHRDDEDLLDVTGYDIVLRRGHGGFATYQDQQEEWLRTGLCPDPGFYFSADTKWLDAERRSWAARQRADLRPEEAVHFLLDGRDGYIEILASGFTWRAWHQGHPRLSAVSGDPVNSGGWTRPEANG